MTFSARQYVRNWGLYVRGVRWLWTRDQTNGPSADGAYWVEALSIRYKPGYGPWRFLPIYLTTYLASVCLGLGVVSLSRWWYDRSHEYCTVCGLGAGPHHGSHVAVWAKHPFSRFMTRLLDWAFPGKEHGKHTGPGNLWGSRSAWE